MKTEPWPTIHQPPVRNSFRRRYKKNSSTNMTGRPPKGTLFKLKGACGGGGTTFVLTNIHTYTSSHVKSISWRQTLRDVLDIGGVFSTSCESLTDTDTTRGCFLHDVKMTPCIMQGLLSRGKHSLLFKKQKKSRNVFCVKTCWFMRTGMSFA